MPDIQIEPTWKERLSTEFELPYFQTLRTFVRDEYKSAKVYPPPASLFRAFNLCPFEKTRIVIVGQDPYHGAGQANGLSFAVNNGVPLPPSLKNIFKEIEQDLGVKPLPSGDLSRWAVQGVLMLNAVLSVRAGSPASHKGKGWESFTDAVISALAKERSQIVYFLWGKYAQEKGAVLDRKKNLVLESAHPSPYSATGFFGHHHFSQCNTYLSLNDQTPIDWR